MDIEQSTLIWIARIVFCLLNAFIALGVWSFMRRERVIILPAPKPYQPPQHIPLPEKNIVVNVMAKPGRIFNNQKIFEEMQKLGFRYGDNHVFEYYVEGTNYVAFSVINIRPPYIFSQDPYEMPPTNGLVAVMQLPVADGDDQVNYFHLLLSVVDKLRANLEGELCDAHRHPLSNQQLYQMQKEIDAFELEYINALQHVYQRRND